MPAGMGKQQGDDLPHAEDFRAWLRKQTDWGDRSISDTLSRAKRVARWVRIDGADDDDEIALLLKKQPRYTGLSESVRSQLKKAAVMYRRFRAARR